MTEKNEKMSGSLGQMKAEADHIRFADEVQSAAATKSGSPWKILVVDDDSDVHAVTRMALADFQFDGCPLEILDAYSGEQAVTMMRANPEVAVVLMDVVMESESAGLDAVDVIRKELGNRRTRIILRTGQPGQAPANAVIRRFGINDYKEKTDLTVEKLQTLIYARLADFQAFMDMDESAARVDNLEQVIRLLRRERSGLELLDHLTDDLQGCTRLSELGALVASSARALSGAPSGAVLFSDDDGSLKPLGVWGDSDGCTLRHKGDCPALSTGNATGTLAVPPGALCRHPELDAAHVCIAITAEDEIRGVLQMIGVTLDTDDTALPLLRTLAMRTGVLAANLLMHERLHAMSVRDGLTGLYNRRFLTESLGIEQARAMRRGAPFALAFFDLDHFKSVNDRYGHQAGDAALVEFAKVLQQYVRKGDIPCRYGGDEFAVVMPGSTEAAAFERAETIRQRWANTPVASGTDALTSFTVSAGVAVSPDGADSPDDLLRRADEALYCAKANGRNRCERASVNR